MEALLPIKGCLVCEQVRDRPSRPVGQDGEGFALAMCILQTSQLFLPRWIMAQEQRRSFGNSPCEGGMADLVARGVQAFAGGCLGTLDQATIRDNILHPWEAVHVMDVIEQHEAENLADTGHAWPQLQGVGVMVCGGLDDGKLQIGKQLVVVRDPSQIDRSAPASGRG
jgi:hypothetical protein